MSQHYFYTDGTYGERSTMTDTTRWSVIVPTNTWSDSMWQALDDALPAKRLDIAKHYNVGVHEYRSLNDDDCTVCGYERNEQ